MQRNILTILFLALGSISVLAQDNPTDSYIEVTGSAEISVIPNIIIYTVELEEYEKDRKIVPMDQIESNFLKAVATSNIDQKNINVSDISSVSLGLKRKRTAYAFKTYNLTFSNPAKLLSFTARLEDLDIKRQFISRLDHTDMAKFRIDTKKSALAAAKTKAEQLLSVVDSKLGKPLIIEEIDPSVAYYRRNPSSNVGYLPESLELLDDIDFKPLKIRFEIKARFAIQ
jgi:uncharacterized protein YggE